jgi:hypothetical protein
MTGEGANLDELSRLAFQHCIFPLANMDMGALSVTDWLGTRHISEPGVPGTSFHSRPRLLPVWRVVDGDIWMDVFGTPSGMDIRDPLPRRIDWRQSASPSEALLRNATRGKPRRGSGKPETGERFRRRIIGTHQVAH